MHSSTVSYFTWSGVLLLFHVHYTQYTIYLVANSTWNMLILKTFCWCCTHLCLRVFVLMTWLPKYEHTCFFLRRFSPPLSISLSQSTSWVFRFGNDNYRYRYCYRNYSVIIVLKRFGFRYPTLVTNQTSDERLIINEKCKYCAPEFIWVNGHDLSGNVIGNR